MKLMILISRHGQKFPRQLPPPSLICFIALWIGDNVSYGVFVTPCYVVPWRKFLLHFSPWFYAKRDGDNLVDGYLSLPCGSLVLPYYVDSMPSVRQTRLRFLSVKSYIYFIICNSFVLFYMYIIIPVFDHKMFYRGLSHCV